MLSPERLRFYPFFQSLNDAQLRAIAMISNEETFNAGEVLFQEGQMAEALYILEDGHIDLYSTLGETLHSNLRKGFPVGEINPGEPFSISALIEPYQLSSSAVAFKASRVIKINAEELRQLFEKDQRLAYLLTYQATKAAVSRLYATRIQLAAAWA